MSAVERLDELINRFDRVNKTALLLNELHSNHYCWNRKHAECAERITYIIEQLKEQQLWYKCSILHCNQQCNKEDLLLTHNLDHITSLKQKCDEIQDRNCRFIDNDTYFNKHTFNIYAENIGSLSDLIIKIMDDEYENGMALIRPPGHHCDINKAMGFCLFNNIACSLNIIRRKYDMNYKYLIIDIDIHHGNGTQNIFYQDENVLFFSIHRSDAGQYYPNTGFMNECGKNKGIGRNINIPLSFTASCGDKQYLYIIDQILIPIIKSFEPHLILISAGFDACIGDEIGQFNVTPYCYGIIMAKILALNIKTVAVLEGGYNLCTMPRAICCVVYALLYKTFDVKEFDEMIIDNVLFDEWKQYIIENENVVNEKKFGLMIKEIIDIQSKYWPILKSDIDENDDNDNDNDDGIYWKCNQCTFINTVCLYECEICDAPNIDKQEKNKYDEKEDESLPMSNIEILSKYLLKSETINNKFINLFATKDDDIICLAKYSVSNHTKIDRLVQLIESEKSKFNGIIFRNDNITNIEILADIIKKIRNLYNNLFIGVEFNFNYLSNDINLIEKNQMRQNKQIINNLHGMGLSIGCDEFIFQFINDHDLIHIINGIYIKNSGITINNKNIASLRCIQRGEFEIKHNIKDFIYFGGVYIGYQHSNNDCKILAKLIKKGYMDCVCFIINQLNIMEIINKLKIFKTEIDGNCKICVVGTLHQISWLNTNYQLTDIVDVFIYTFQS